MGLASTHISTPERRDRLFFISPIAIAILTLLGAAGESIGFDRKLKVNTVKTRTHSLLRQGIFYDKFLQKFTEDRNSRSTPLLGINAMNSMKFNCNIRLVA